ncbi:MAG: hypothetical protein R2705_13990 [Ilumatobacteraceae bacterium]
MTLPPLEDFKPVAADPNDADSEPDLPLGRVTEWANLTLDLGDGPKRYRRPERHAAVGRVGQPSFGTWT